MAKTTKSTKRPSATKQKKGGLFSKINFKSRKTQFISVILLIAVMGGSWFTYRSFASSQSVSVFAVNMITNGDKIEEKRTNSGKNSVTVVQINNDENILWFTGQTTAKGNVYEVCPLASGLTSSSTYRLELQGAAPSTPGSDRITAQPVNYRSDCRQFVATSPVQNVYVKMNSDAGSVRASSISFRLVRANSYASQGPVTTNPTK